MYFKDPRLSAALAEADVVVFDMNGTILDDEPVQWEASNEVLKSFGVTLSEPDFIAKCVGRKMREWMSKVLPSCNDNEMDKLLEAREQAYGRLVGARVPDLVRPGAVDLIRFVKEKTDKPLALATSSPPINAEIILDRGLGLISLFDKIVTGLDVRLSKPDPEIYRCVQAAFPAARRFIAIEDTWAGVTAAKAAGMTCIAIPSRFTGGQDFSAADFIVTDLTPAACLKG